jgi:hypothetical protein
MGLSPNRSLTVGPTRSGGLLSRLGSWFKPKSGGAPAAPQPAGIQDLLDRLTLTQPATGPVALADPAAAQAARQLSVPGQALSVTPAGWEALATQFQRLGAADRTRLASQLAAGGVKVDAGTDGRYVSFTANGLRVTAEPATQRLRRTQGDTVLGYEGSALVTAMKVAGDKVEVTTAEGKQTWVAGAGQGYEDGLPIAPRFAAPVPGEAPRNAWATPPSDDLVEPTWTTGTRMAEYGPAYDQAMAATGGAVVQPTQPNAAATDMYNCHSFATTGGQGDLFDPFMRETHPHWLNNPMYRLTNGPFAQVADTQRVHPGDVVVYRKDGVVTHTGVVREVDADGNPSLVESKFGTLGLYEHEPFDIPASYGEPSAFYRPTA